VRFKKAIKVSKSFAYVIVSTLVCGISFLLIVSVIARIMQAQELHLREISQLTANKTINDSLTMVLD
jgi:hypothetical protein